MNRLSLFSKLAFLLLSPAGILILALQSTAQDYRPISLDNIFQDHQFLPKTLEDIQSMSDGEHYTVLESGQAISRYDYLTGGDKTILFTTKQFPENGPMFISGYAFSKDEKKILLTTSVSGIYRHSFEAEYWIYNLSNDDLKPLTDSGKVQLATFSPDGLKVAYVSDNNLFYNDLINGCQVKVTSDGERNQVINGAPDWVYEEEFGFSQGYCWSPDSRCLAYYRFDESQVKQFDMTLFNDLYPSVTRFKYPKAGEANSVVSIHVFNLETGKSMEMDTGVEEDQYIPRIKWTEQPGKLGIIRLNRLQNKVDVLIADAASGASKSLYCEENERFLSRIDDNFIHFTADQQHFIILSERTGYFHYYLYSMEGEMINPITQGNWEVSEILGIDETRRVMYYTSNQSSVINKDVYTIHLDGKGQNKLSDTPGTNHAEFSSSYQYYINTWSDANTPFRYTLHRMDGSLIRILEDNTSLKNELKTYGFTSKELIKIPVSPDLELNAYIIKPPDFDSTRKYPLFMSVYGGPESQDVTNAWDNGLAWQQLLAQQGIIVACVDNRGTDGRGEEFRKSTYLQLGKFETVDQVNAARYLGNKAWIDEKRIGIWGWSYGGYMALLCLTRGDDVFSMGIAVAPVTNWRSYDNIYTERYMRRPQDNTNGYDENSPINHAGELKGKLLLVHGTADDNVHFQNSMEMAERLILENKQFQQFFYPNRNHHISGGNTRLHLYVMLTTFIRENL